MWRVKRSYMYIIIFKTSLSDETRFTYYYIARLSQRSLYSYDRLLHSRPNRFTIIQIYYTNNRTRSQQLFHGNRYTIIYRTFDIIYKTNAKTNHIFCCVVQQSARFKLYWPLNTSIHYYIIIVDNDY